MKIPKEGEAVFWKWAGSIAQGVAKEIHVSRVQVQSKGKLITRNGTEQNPAIVIQHKNGNEVLKLASELIG